MTPCSWQPRREGLRILFSQGHELPLIPLSAGTKLPLAGFDLEGVLKGETKPEDTRRYFEEDPGLNYAVPCVRGYFVLDFDRLDNYLQFFPNREKLEAQTMCVSSPHGGVHVWLKTSEEVHRRIRFSENLDLLGLGGYAVGPGSILAHGLCDAGKHGCPHTGQGRYEVADSFEILSAESLLPGRSVLSAIAERADGLGWEVRAEARPIATVVRGGVRLGERNVSAFRLSRYFVHYLNLDEPSAWEQLETWNGRLDQPLLQAELRRTFDSAKKRPYKTPRKEWREI